MSKDAFRNLDELHLRNVFDHLSKFGSYVYLWKAVDTQKFITSSEVYHLFGLDPHPEEFTANDFDKLIHPEDIAAVKQAEKELLLGKNPESTEYRINTGDGREKFIRQSIELIRNANDLQILIIMQDITEQKRADIILNIMNEAFFDLDNQLIFRKVNLQAELFWNRKRADLIGKNILDVFPKITGTPFYEMIVRIKDSKTAERKEVVFPDNDKWIGASVASYFDGIIFVFFDITEQKKTDTELQTLNKSLEKKNRELEHKNTELSSFGYITSNDLKAPLRKLYTSFEIILTREGAKLSNNAKAHFRKIQASLQKMNLITDDLVSFSRINKDGEQLEQTDLNRILEESEEKLIKNQDKILEVISAVLPVINGYPELLLQLFSHILANGIKFQSGKNIPLITIQYQKIHGETEFHDQRGLFHKISFQDNGIGFDMQYASDIFNLFFKIHPQNEYKGTGVGLAICKKIMDRHGGMINASSSEAGSVFNCYFPLAF